MKRAFSLRRRSALLGAAATIAVPALVRAQGRKVQFTMPWLAQGGTGFIQVAKAIGAFKDRGIDIQLSRGFGSLAASQAVAQKKFDFGVVSAGPMILTAARGTPLTALATLNYDTTMGVLVRSDSPVRKISDLAGRKVGAVITSAEYPFWPAFASASGLDVTKVTIVQMDNRILERAVIDGQVDAITAIGASSIPVVKAQGVEHRFFTFSSAGIAPYANVLTTRPELVETDPALCEAVTSALLDGVAYQLRNPEKSIDLLMQEVPEIAMTANAKENARLSQGLLQSTMIAPESMTHGLGWSDPDGWRKTVDLTMQYAVPSGTARPAVDDVAKNRFAGKVKLTAAEWAGLQTSLAPFRQMMG